MHNHGLRTLILLGLLLCLVCTTAYGQDDTPTPSGWFTGWSLDVTPFYLWLPALDGDVTVRGRTATVDASVSDFIELLFDDARFVFTGRVEARYRDLLFFVDLLFLSLEDEQDAPLQTRTTFEFRQIFFEFGIGYRLGTQPFTTSPQPSMTIDALAGARYVYLDADLAIRGTGPLGLATQVSRNVDWIDPFMGLRFRFDLSKRWTLVLRGDVGGFDVGSNFTWNLVGTLQYHVSRRITVLVGYRVLDIDYDEGNGPTRLVFDLQMRGPGFGTTIHF